MHDINKQIVFRKTQVILSSIAPCDSRCDEKLFIANKYVHCLHIYFSSVSINVMCQLEPTPSLPHPCHMLCPCVSGNLYMPPSPHTRYNLAKPTHTSKPPPHSKFLHHAHVHAHTALTMSPHLPTASVTPWLIYLPKY